MKTGHPRRHIHLRADLRAEVQKGHKTNDKHYYRERCHALLLSHDGYTISEIAKILGRKEDTIGCWYTSFERGGLEALYIKPGRGLKPRLDKADNELVELVKKKLVTSPSN